MKTFIIHLQELFGMSRSSLHISHLDVRTDAAVDTFMIHTDTVVDILMIRLQGLFQN